MPDVSQPCPQLPAPVAFAATQLPLRFLYPLIEQQLNRVLAESLQNNDLALLDNREFGLCIDDLGVTIGFTLSDRQLRVIAPHKPTAMVSGPLAAFAWLASGRSDADALFFNRHLLIEGDTELGLVIKNVIDTTDLARLPALLRHGLDLLVRVIPAQPPGRV